MANVSIGVGTSEVAQITSGDTVRVLVYLLQDADPTAGATGIAFDAAGMTVEYAKFGDSALTTFPTFDTDNWDELGRGWYALIIRGSDAGELALLNTVGDLVFYVKATATKAANKQLRVVPFDAARQDTNGRTPADVTAVSGDSAAANNLEAMYDGTGYTDPLGPAQQQQLDSLANVGAAIHRQAESYDLTTGTQASGTVTSTEALDGVYHQHTDDAGTLELYYQFDVGAQGVPTLVTFSGRINSANDSMAVWAYNWAGTSWDQVGTWPGQGSSIDGVQAFTLFTSQVGTGANLGKVRIRIFQAGLTTANLYVDQVFVSYAVVNTVGSYERGRVWLDTVNGVAGTVSDFNGTVGNPVSNIADANVIATAKGLSEFQIVGPSSFTFAAAQQGQGFYGNHWTLAMGGQDLANTVISGAAVSGIAVGATAPTFERCHIGDITVPPSHFDSCSLEGTITAGSAGDFLFEDCKSGIAGSTTPKFSFGQFLNASNARFGPYSGGMEFEYAGEGTGTYNISVETDGQVLFNANCSASTIAELRGLHTLTNNASGLTINDDARVDAAQILNAITSDQTKFQGADVPAILEDTATTIPALIAALNNLSQAQAEAACDAAFATWDPPTEAEMDAAHALLATLAAQTVIDGNVDSILVDTGTDIPATLGLPADIDLATDIANVKTDTAAVLDDTGTSGVVVASLTAAAIDSILDETLGFSGGADVTVRDALRKAWVQGGGDWSRAGLVLTLRQPDASASEVVFDLDDADAPTERIAR